MMGTERQEATIDRPPSLPALFLERGRGITHTLPRVIYVTSFFQKFFKKGNDLLHYSYFPEYTIL